MIPDSKNENRNPKCPPCGIPHHYDSQNKVRDKSKIPMWTSRIKEVSPTDRLRPTDEKQRAFVPEWSNPVVFWPVCAGRPVCRQAGKKSLKDKIIDDKMICNYLPFSKVAQQLHRAQPLPSQPHHLPQQDRLLPEKNRKPPKKDRHRPKQDRPLPG